MSLKNIISSSSESPMPKSRSKKTIFLPHLPLFLSIPFYSLFLLSLMTSTKVTAQFNLPNRTDGFDGLIIGDRGFTLEFTEQRDAAEDTSGVDLSDDDFIRNYTIIPLEYHFYKNACVSNPNCYGLRSNSLACVNNTCVCLDWLGIQLQYDAERTICLGAGGHPCILGSECRSRVCLPSKICSTYSQGTWIRIQRLLIEFAVVLQILMLMIKRSLV